MGTQRIVSEIEVIRYIYWLTYHILSKFENTSKSSFKLKILLDPFPIIYQKPTPYSLEVLLAYGFALDNIYRSFLDIFLDSLLVSKAFIT